MNTERVRLAAVVFVVLFTQLLVYPGIEELVAALGADPTIDASTAFLAVQLAAFVLFSTAWGVVSDRTVLTEIEHLYARTHDDYRELQAGYDSVEFAHGGLTVST